MNEYERHMGAAGDPAGAGNTSGSDRERSPEEIQREIEMTRERMSQNIDQLGEKLSPENLKRQAKDAITGKAQDMVNNVGYQARDTGSRVFDFIRDNPLPVAAVGLGAVWLVQQRNRSEISGDRMARFAYTGPERRRDYSAYAGSGSSGREGQFDQSAFGTSSFSEGTSQYEGRRERADEFGFYESEESQRARRLPGMVRENPLLLAALGFGAAWLLQQRGRGELSGDRMASGTYGERRGSGIGGRIAERAGHIKDTVSEAASNVAERAGELAGGARERAGDLAGSARERVSNVGTGARERAGNLGSRARERTQRARGGLEHMMEDNPLAVAAGAAILGLTIGLLVPESDRENRLMGPARDNLVDRAQTTARRVKDAAVEAGQEVREVVREEVQYRAPEIKSTLKDAAKSVTSEVKDAAGRVKEQAKQAAKDRPV
jgi:ElaB/YqjD/DUF883 family membrane-anchored ribosome-binding protein